MPTLAKQSTDDREGNQGIDLVPNHRDGERIQLSLLNRKKSNSHTSC